jgi:uncharacterized FlaG/YvyC family protein
MEVSSVNSAAGAGVPTGGAAASKITPQQATERRQILQATKALNQHQAFGPDNEVVFSIDPKSGRAITRVVNSDTQEVVMQIPPEYVLELAQDFSKKA